MCTGYCAVQLRERNQDWSLKCSELCTVHLWCTRHIGTPIENWTPSVRIVYRTQVNLYGIKGDADKNRHLSLGDTVQYTMCARHLSAQ